MDTATKSIENVYAGVVDVKAEARAWKVESASREGVEHTVAIGADGTITCTCDGFKYRKRCWHTKMLREHLGIFKQVA